MHDRAIRVSDLMSFQRGLCVELGDAQPNTHVLMRIDWVCGSMGLHESEYRSEYGLRKRTVVFAWSKISLALCSVSLIMKLDPLLIALDLACLGARYPGHFSCVATEQSNG